jgi:ubiquinone biosynthesis monooxygenase Coq7
MFDLDAAICRFDNALRTATGTTPGLRKSPAAAVADAELTPSQRSHSAGLMRVNHVGEVCAQALYAAQGSTAGSAEIAQQFADAAREEQDHLAWTAQRLTELGARPSLLNPLWYAGAYLMGAVAGRLGDAASLGFVVETERQVEAHLSSHLERLPVEDLKSRAIVEQMRQDEAAHGQHAEALGAAAMPRPAALAMGAVSRVMTTLAYYI